MDQPGEKKDDRKKNVDGYNYTFNWFVDGVMGLTLKVGGNIRLKKKNTKWNVVAVSFLLYSCHKYLWHINSNGSTEFLNKYGISMWKHFSNKSIYV